jgi:hypothetical protein
MAATLVTSPKKNGILAALPPAEIDRFFAGLQPVSLTCALAPDGRDRVDDDAIPMTHEFLATMFGVRRAGVTETIGVLHRSGLIQKSPRDGRHCRSRRS